MCRHNLLLEPYTTREHDTHRCFCHPTTWNRWYTDDGPYTPCPARAWATARASSTVLMAVGMRLHLARWYSTLDVVRPDMTLSQ